MKPNFERLQRQANRLGAAWNENDGRKGPVMKNGRKKE